MGIVFFLIIFSVQANAGNQTIKKSSFYDWDYAVWVWSNLKTLDALNGEWEKFDKPLEEWKKRYSRDPEKALAELENGPKAEAIKKGQSMELVYKWLADKGRTHATRFWQVYERDCYEGGATYGISQEKNNYKLTDVWAQMNIFTGKCDWPDWRSARGIAGDVDWKADYMGNLKAHTRYSKH